jgi:hypothetical protein
MAQPILTETPAYEVYNNCLIAIGHLYRSRPPIRCRVSIGRQRHKTTHSCELICNPAESDSTQPNGTGRMGSTSVTTLRRYEITTLRSYIKLF